MRIPLHTRRGVNTGSIEAAHPDLDNAATRADHPHLKQHTVLYVTPQWEAVCPAPFPTRSLPWQRLVQARALGVGGTDGAGAGVRRRASLREDDAGNGEGQASGEILEASGSQKAGAAWTGTKRTGAGLWPQLLVLSPPVPGLVSMRSLPEYHRVNGPYKLILSRTGEYKLPFGNLPCMLLAWIWTKAVRTQRRELILGDSPSEFMQVLGVYSY